MDESAVQAKDKVNEVNLRLEHIIEQILHVSKEQNYERVCVLKIFDIALLVYILSDLLFNCSVIFN